VEQAIQLGAEDIINHDDGSIEIITNPSDFTKIKEEFDQLQKKYELAEVTMRPDVEVELVGIDGEKMQKILDALDDLDDVQEVYSNGIII